MRLSTEEGDPGHCAWCELRATEHHVVVLLDGAAVDRCVTADEELGVVTVCVVDRDGRPTIAEDEFVYDTLSGAVRIVISPIVDARARH